MYLGLKGRRNQSYQTSTKNLIRRKKISIAYEMSESGVISWISDNDQSKTDTDSSFQATITQNKYLSIVNILYHIPKNYFAEGHAVAVFLENWHKETDGEVS